MAVMCRLGAICLLRSRSRPEGICIDDNTFRLGNDYMIRPGFRETRWSDIRVRGRCLYRQIYTHASRRQYGRSGRILKNSGQAGWCVYNE